VAQLEKEVKKYVSGNETNYAKGASESPELVDIVRPLLHLRESLNDQASNQQLTAEAGAAREQVIEIVNQFLYEKLVAMEGIREY
jgi:hypothetical protein